MSTNTIQNSIKSLKSKQIHRIHPANEFKEMMKVRFFGHLLALRWYLECIFSCALRRVDIDTLDE
jgi:hypothetical protein